MGPNRYSLSDSMTICNRAALTHQRASTPLKYQHSSRRHSRHHTVSKDSGSSTESEQIPSRIISHSHHLHIQCSHRRHNHHCSYSRPGKDGTMRASSPRQRNPTHTTGAKNVSATTVKKHQSHQWLNFLSNSTSESSTDDDSYSSSSTTSPEPKQWHRRVSSSPSSSPHPRRKRRRGSASSRDSGHKQYLYVTQRCRHHHYHHHHYRQS